MKIRMNTLAAGPTFHARPGEVVDCDLRRAKELVAGGYAVELTKESIDGPETDGAADDTTGERRRGKAAAQPGG